MSEARRADGIEYPSKTIYQMFCGMLHHTKESQLDPPNFLDRKDVCFKKFHSTEVFRSLHKSGIGAKKTSTPAITKEDESKLWETGVQNAKTPTGLQRAVFITLERFAA